MNQYIYKMINIDEKNNIKEHDTVDYKSIFSKLKFSSTKKLNYFWLDKQKYNTIWDLQKYLHKLRYKKKIPNCVLFLEHLPVYTYGKNANLDHLLDSYPKDAEVVKIDRGGDITFHGPGQLVIYPIIDLHDYKLSISWYMRKLEQIVMDVLMELGVFANRKNKLTGVWVEDEKICAMGVRISKWITMHGLAINVTTKMKYFDSMIPCGIFQYGVTSLEELEINISTELLVELFIKEFDKNLN